MADKVWKFGPLPAAEIQSLLAATRAMNVAILDALAVMMNADGAVPPDDTEAVQVSNDQAKFAQQTADAVTQMQNLTGAINALNIAAGVLKGGA